MGMIDDNLKACLDFKTQMMAFCEEDLREREMEIERRKKKKQKHQGDEDDGRS